MPEAGLIIRLLIIRLVMTQHQQHDAGIADSLYDKSFLVKFFKKILKNTCNLQRYELF